MFVNYLLNNFKCAENSISKILTVEISQKSKIFTFNSLNLIVIPPVFTTGWKFQGPRENSSSYFWKMLNLSFNVLKIV